MVPSTADLGDEIGEILEFDRKHARDAKIRVLTPIKQTSLISDRGSMSLTDRDRNDVVLSERIDLSWSRFDRLKDEILEALSQLSCSVVAPCKGDSLV